MGSEIETIEAEIVFDDSPTISRDDQLSDETIADLNGYTAPRPATPYSPASLDQAVAASRTAHRRAGFDGQPNPRAALDLIKVHLQDRAKQGGRTRRAKPVTLDVLRLMLATLD